MALSKSITTNFGVPATYWRVGILNNHPRYNSVQIVLDGYTSKTVREEFVNNPLISIQINASSTDIATGCIKDVYTYVKTLPEWSDATDETSPTVLVAPTP